MAGSQPLSISKSPGLGKRGCASWLGLPHLASLRTWTHTALEEFKMVPYYIYSLTCKKARAFAFHYIQRMFLVSFCIPGVRDRSSKKLIKSMSIIILLSSLILIFLNFLNTRICERWIEISYYRCAFHLLPVFFSLYECGLCYLMQGWHRRANECSLVHTRYVIPSLWLALILIIKCTSWPHLMFCLELDPCFLFVCICLLSLAPCFYFHSFWVLWIGECLLPPA